VAARPSAPRPRDLRPRRDPPTLRDLRPRRERAGPATYPASATYAPAATAPPRDLPRPQGRQDARGTLVRRQGHREIA